MAPKVAQPLKPQDWEAAGTLVVAGALAVVVAYAAVRLAQCRTALQRTGELVRAFGVALGVAAISLLFGPQFLPASAQLHTWLNQQELPLRVAVTLALTVLGLAVPFRVVHFGTRLYWQGCWTFSRSLPTSPRPAAISRSRSAGMLLWLAGWACEAIGVVGTLWAYGNILAGLDEGSVTVPVAWFVGAGAMVLAGRAILKQARRYLAPVLTSAADLPAGSYVLYLRPFAIDEDRALVSSPTEGGGAGAAHLFEVLMTGDSDEQQITTTLRPVGTVVGVGAPGERLPYRGAMRMYLPKDRWQPTVAELITKARLVVVTLASSAGTMWELAEAMRTLPPQRLLLMVPPMRREQYAAIRAQNIEDLRDTGEPRSNPTWINHSAPSLPSHLPDMDGSSVQLGLIRFSEGWQPTFFTIRRHNPMRSLSPDLRSGLRPALNELYAYEQRTGERYS